MGLVRTKVVGAFVAALLLASGCVGREGDSKGAASAGPSSVATVGSANESANAGTIEGRVTDDELRPVANATAAIAKLGASVRTGTDGAFRFENVPAGRHALVAEALGFGSVAVPVEVRAAEVTRADLVLVPIALLEPYMTVVPHTALVHVGGYVTAAANNLPMDTACQGCLWTMNFTAGPSYVFIEVDGKHTVRNAHRADGFALFLNKRVGSQQSTGYVRDCPWPTNPSCLDLPVRFGLNGTDLEEAEPRGKATGFRFWQFCDPLWFCVEERYTEWVSLFYNTPFEMVPPDYTARPKG